MASEDGGPAFPTHGEKNGNDDYIVWPAQGMSLRDWYAGQALAGIHASRETFLAILKDRHSSQKPLDAVAESAFDMADAMLKAREA